MNEIRKPLKRSILCGILLFIFVLCVVLTGVQHFTIRRSLYRQYKDRIRSVLNYAETRIDPDDLAECIRTGQESEQFRLTQTALDEIKEQTGVHYLYVIIPLNTEETDRRTRVRVRKEPTRFSKFLAVQLPIMQKQANTSAT